MQILVTGAYHSGGAAYVLSREALRRFYAAYHESDSLCTKQGPNEDIHIAACLRSTGVYAGRSLDQNNRERFHPLPFSTHYLGPIPSWLQIYAQHKPLVVKKIPSSSISEPMQSVVVGSKLLQRHDDFLSSRHARTTVPHRPNALRIFWDETPRRLTTSFVRLISSFFPLMSMCVSLSHCRFLPLALLACGWIDTYINVDDFFAK